MGAVVCARKRVMKLQAYARIRLWIPFRGPHWFGCLLGIVIAATSSLATPITESFDGWNKSAYDGEPATYFNPLSGVWYAINATVRSDNNHDRGHAVRFRQQGVSPFLDYRGPTGEGLLGGIESVAFDYAHWNGNANVVRFQLQYSTDGLNWLDLDDEVTATDTAYSRYEWAGLLLAEPLFLRVQSIVHNERLLINDFEIQPYSGPRVLVATNRIETQPSTGMVHLPVWVHPPVDASVDIVVDQGGEWEGVLFNLVETQLIFSASAPTQTLALALLDPGVPIPDPEITLVFTNAAGALVMADPAISLLIQDEQLPRVSIAPATTSVLESADPIPLHVTLSEPGHATVQVHRAGTALEGVDYTLNTTQLVFHANGPVEQTIWLDPIDNDIGDGDRDVVLTLVPVAGVNAGDDLVATITLIDDEPFANFTTSASWLTIEDGAATIVVELDEAVDAVVGVDVIVADAHMDYTVSATSLVFSADGPTAQSVTFTPIHPGTPSPPFRLTLALSGNQGFRPGPQSQHAIGVRSHRGVVVMAANLTSGNFQHYLDPGKRLLQGLMPDVVGIQEFRVEGLRRDFVDELFGPDFHYVVEEGVTLPCGIISRWPILEWGIWYDPVVGNRNFIWAIIDVPHLSRNLQVVSAHFYASGSASDRNAQAQNMVNRMHQDFHPADYTVLAADLNTQNRLEPALATLEEWVVDESQPVDQLGNPNTNAGRNRPYDFVLPNAHLEARQAPLPLGEHLFAEGLVFDSRLWTTPPYPIQVGDSGVQGMQHMAIVKYFEPVSAPTIYLRELRILDLGDGGNPLQRGGEYGWEIEWGIEGTATLYNVSITLESLSPDIKVLGACHIADTLVDGYGPYISTGACTLVIAPDAENGAHPMAVTFTSDIGSWTNAINLYVWHDFIAEAVDTPGWTWTHFGDWYLQTNITTDGVDAIMNTGIPPHTGHWIETVVEGPGRIHFDWWLSPDVNYGTHYLQLLENNMTRRLKFSPGWESTSQHMSSGMRTLRWEHYNFSGSDSLGASAIDQVWFEPYTNQILAISPGLGTYHLTGGSRSNVTPQYLFIRNLDETPMSYTVDVDTDWLITTAAGGTVQGPLAFGHPYQYELDALVEGVHTTRFTVVAAGADDGEQTIVHTTTVHPPLEPPIMPETLSWSSGGGYGPWRVTNLPEQVDAPMLASGPASWQGDSWLLAEVAGPGMVEFEWRCDGPWDTLAVLLNGETVESSTGVMDWESVAIPLAPGTHRLVWRFSSNSGASANRLGYIADLRYAGEPDRDGDGLPDWWEALHFGEPTAAHPLVDEDGDGFLNWQEFVAGTDPNDRFSFFQVGMDLMSHTLPHVFFPHTLTNRVYAVFGAESLTEPDWQPVIDAVPGTGAPMLVPLTNAPGTLIFRGAVRMPEDE